MRPCCAPSAFWGQVGVLFRRCGMPSTCQARNGQRAIPIGYTFTRRASNRIPMVARRFKSWDVFVSKFLPLATQM